MIKLLIVEDDPLMSRMYHKIFAYEGYDISVAGDGEVGWNKVKDEKPNLVLLDVMMPKLNGMQLLERIKADPELKKIPVVMLTNLAGSQDAENALEKGAIKYIVKSEYDPKQIVAMIKEIIAGYTRNEVPPSPGQAKPPNTNT